MRRCFQCGAKTDVEQLTRVGDGEFCASCFGELLGAGAAEGAPAAEVTRSDRAAPAAASSALPRRTRCLVCERDLAGVPAVVFLGGEICGGCSAEMATELETVDEESAAPAPHRREPTAAAPEHALFTPGAGTARCAGCERPMPGPGSYRVLRGKPYCSACWPVFSQLPAAVVEGAPVAAAPALDHSPHSSADAARCDCCARALDEDAASRHGFRLCGACLSSDPELALRVARARHRRELLRLGTTLEEDG